MITVTGADGWYYNYFHVNDDTPGTDDGAAGPEWQVAPADGRKPGPRRQVIGYMGDSGNAEGWRRTCTSRSAARPDAGEPYLSLAAADRAPDVRTTCGDVARIPTAVPGGGRDHPARRRRSLADRP